MYTYTHICTHTQYNSTTKIYPIHMNTQRWREFTSVQERLFLGGGNKVLWWFIFFFTFSYNISIKNMYCFYNQEENKTPKSIINESGKKTCRQPVLETPVSQSITCGPSYRVAAEPDPGCRGRVWASWNQALIQSWSQGKPVGACPLTVLAPWKWQCVKCIFFCLLKGGDICCHIGEMFSVILWREE